jgi:hypothetical protein
VTRIPGPVPGTLSREQALDELELLAGVEHALVVEHLTLQCVFGHDDLPAEEGGPATPEAMAAAEAASNLAMTEMFHLKNLGVALAEAGRRVLLGRATSVSSRSVAEIPLDPPGGADLDRWSERGAAIAEAVDERYRALAPAVTSDPVFEEDLLSQLQAVIIDAGPTHRTAFATVQDALGPRPPAEVVQVTRRETDDRFEQQLLAVGDHLYGLIVEALRGTFTSSDAAPDFRRLATSAMSGLDGTNKLLVRRGLLAPYTPV